MTYSQKGEQPVILKHFAQQPPGRLLDIGAYDGRTFSNTLALIERGWDAVLVEPSPGPFAAMERLHKDRNGKVLCFNVAISKDPGISVEEVRFWASDDAVATLDKRHYEKWKDAAAFTESTVTAWSVKYLLEQVGREFDFINIDIEGFSAELWFQEFAGNLVPSAYCVEHDDRADAIELKGMQMGYRRAYLDGNNIILVR